MRSLTTWLEDSYCSIAVANHRLIIINRFITKSYIHLWKSFVNKFYLVLHAEPNMFHDEPNRACLRFILTRPWSNWVFSFENFKLNLFIMSSQRERESLYYGQIGLIQCNNQSNCKLLGWPAECFSCQPTVTLSGPRRQACIQRTVPTHACIRNSEVLRYQCKDGQILLVVQAYYNLLVWNYENQMSRWSLLQ